jgi:hypothetical protein
MPTLDDVIFRFLGDNQLSGPLLQIARDMGLVQTGADGAAISTGVLGDMVGGLATAAGGAIILAGVYMEVTDALQQAGDETQRQTAFTVALGDTVGQTSAVMAQWGGTIDQVVSDTGRGRVEIMGISDDFALAGIKNQDTMKSIEEATTASAYMTGNSVDSVGSAFERMILSGKVLPKTLATYGLSLADLGVTSQQFAADTADERAQILSAAVAKKGGAQANEAYKESYAGMIDRIQQAWQNFQIAIGDSLLPLVIPILGAFANALGWIAHGVQLIPGPLLVLGLGIVTLTGFILVAAGLMTVWIPISAALAGILGTDATVMGILGGAIGMLMPDFTALAMGMGATDMEATYLGVTMVGTSGGVMAFAGAVWAATTAVMAFLFTTPIGWLILLGIAIAAVITYFGWWGPIIDGTKNLLSGLWNIIKIGAADIGNLILNFTPLGGIIKVVMNLKAGWDAFMKTAAGTQVMAGWIWLLTAVGHGMTILMADLGNAGQWISHFITMVGKAMGITNSAGKSFDYVGAIVWWLTGIFGGLTYAAHLLLFVFQNFYIAGTWIANALQIAGNAAQKFICWIIGCSPGIVPALKLLSAAVNIAMIPIRYFGSLILAMGQLVLQGINLVLNHFGILPQNIQMYMNLAWDVINVVWNDMKSLFATALTILQPIINAFTTVQADITTVLTTLWSFIQTIASNIGNAFTQLGTIVVTAIMTIVTSITTNLMGALTSIKSFICAIVGCSPGLVPAFQLLGRTVPDEVSRILPHIAKLNAVIPNAHIGFGGIGTGGSSAGAGGSTYSSTSTSGVVNHNETIHIDASNMSKADLKDLLIQIYENP